MRSIDRANFTVTVTLDKEQWPRCNKVAEGQVEINISYVRKVVPDLSNLADIDGGN